MGALKRINGGIGQGQWGFEKGQVRGLALDRGVAVGQTGGCLTGL